MASLNSVFHFGPDQEESDSNSLTSTSFYFGFEDDIPYNQGRQLHVSDDEESEEESGPATAEDQPNHEAEGIASGVAEYGHEESRINENEDIQGNGQRRPVLRLFYRALFGPLFVTALVLRYFKDLFVGGYEQVLRWIDYTVHMRMQLDDLA